MNTLETRPRVFLSSTIYDFVDLRSALKYWLEELGYEVFASEYNNFPKELSENSYSACLEAIRAADYFILLMGARAGGYYDTGTKTTITMKEYRCAYECAIKGSLKIASFVRQSIWDVQEDRKALGRLLREEYANEHDLTDDDIDQIQYHRSKIIKDADVIFSFMNEVGRNAEMKAAVDGSGSLPAANWIHPFSSFRDIVDALRGHFIGRNGMRRVALEEGLRLDLMDNIRLLLLRCAKTGNINPLHQWANPARRQFTGGSTESSVIKGKRLGRLGLFGLFGAAAIDFRTQAIDEAIVSGEFLRFDRNEDRYVAGPLHRALLQLKTEMEQARIVVKMVVSQDLRQLQSYLDAEDEYTISNEMLAPIFSLQDRHRNILSLSKTILLTLDGKQFEFPDLAARSPYPGQAKEIENETPDDEDIWKWVHDSAIIDDGNTGESSEK